MTTSHAEKKISKYLLPLISLFAIIAYAVLVESIWQWKTVLATWQKIGWHILLAGIGLIFITHLVRGLRMYHFFKQDTMRFTTLFYLSQTHNLLNNLLPFRSGEVSFPLLMKNQFGTPLFSSAAGLLWLRLLDAHTLGMLALAVILIKYQLPALLVAVILLVTFFVPLFIFWLHPLISKQLLKQIEQTKNKNHKIKLKAALIIKKLLSGIPASPRLFYNTWILTWLNWLIKIGLMGVIVAVLLSNSSVVSITHHLVAGLAGAVAGEITSILPINAPAGVGTYAGGVYVGIHWAQPQNVILKHAMLAGINLHLLIMLSAFVGVGLAAMMNYVIHRQTHKTS